MDSRETTCLHLDFCFLCSVSKEACQPDRTLHSQQLLFFLELRLHLPAPVLLLFVLHPRCYLKVIEEKVLCIWWGKWNSLRLYKRLYTVKDDFIKGMYSYVSNVGLIAARRNKLDLMKNRISFRI